jgi:predicted ATPase/predicted Ser/Thr protein kinase
MERWATVKRLHQAALEREASERAAFLDDACAGDDTLRREVDSLLAHEPAAAAFLETSAVEITARGLRGELDTPVVARTLGHFQVESLLGAGGMGEVYLAHDARLDRAVALKILPRDLLFDADRLQRFLCEAKAASALNHPNVATIHDIGESDGVSFIVMEYVEGQTLAEQMTGQPLSVSEIVDIASQVADALEAAHAKGITHRDIKPANLMRTPRGQVKVLDFGIAKTRRAEEAGPTGVFGTGSQTAAGLVVGSLPYMSPEQLLGREVDHRSDIFSLGVTLYELATGRHPFAGATATETTDRILHASPGRIARLNAAIPSELEHIASKCLEKDRERRYPSAGDLLQDLRLLKQQTDAIASAGQHLDTPRHNLPAQLTSFVGRRREIEEITHLLATTRLLTLSGSGGCGKTRLALQAATELVGRFRDGVWLVDLSPLSEPDLVTSSLAAVLNVQEGSQRSLSEVLSGFVRTRRLLIILDNCEHLISACAHLAETLLKAGADICILATSRESLGLAGERVWRVPSLSAPSSTGTGAESIAEFEAVTLFVDRATAVAPSFAISDENAPVIAEICRRLDGIPLAIELAAARLNMLSVDQINERLNDRFRLLTGGSRTALARQRTLEATVDWSYDLLSPTERRLLCRLSVFAGGWTLEAAEAVCGGDGIGKQTMLDLLSHLVDKSLVIAEENQRRYRLLETVRQYGRERLLRSRQVERIRDRHFAFFLELVRRAEPHLQSHDQVDWLNHLQLEYDNLRPALEWSATAPKRQHDGLELAAALLWFWMKRGLFAEGRQWLERALALETHPSPALRIKALVTLAHMAYFSGDYPDALTVLDELLALGRDTGDRYGISWALAFRSVHLIDAGRFDEAERLASEARSIAAEGGERWVEALALMFQALTAQYSNHYDRANHLYDQLLERARATGDKLLISNVLGNLASLRVMQGNYRDAKAVGAEAIKYSEALSDHRGLAWSLEPIAAAAAAEGEARRAARLWGASDHLLEHVGSPLTPALQSFRTTYFSHARELLGEDAFQEALSEGRMMSLKQAVHYALAAIGTPDVFANSRPYGPLSDRQAPPPGRSRTRDE